MRGEKYLFPGANTHEEKQHSNNQEDRNPMAKDNHCKKKVRHHAAEVKGLADIDLERFACEGRK